MSLIKLIKQQLGISTTPANNFVLDASAANGTMKLARGNAGATTQDILKVEAGGNLTLYNTPYAPGIIIDSGVVDGGNATFKSLGAQDWGIDNYNGEFRFLGTAVSGVLAAYFNTIGEFISQIGLRVNKLLRPPVLNVGANTTFSLDTSTVVTLSANGSGLYFVDMYNCSGLLVLNNHGSGGICLYLCGGGQVVLVSSSGGPIGASVSYNVGIAGYTIINTNGYASNFGICMIRTRPTA